MVAFPITNRDLRRSEKRSQENELVHFFKKPKLRPNKLSRLAKRFKIGQETVRGFHTSDR